MKRFPELKLIIVLLCFLTCVNLLPAESLPVSLMAPFFTGTGRPSPPAAGGPPAATVIFTTYALGTSGGCTTSATNAVGSTLIVDGIRGYRSPYPSPSDSQGNSYTDGTGAGTSGSASIIDYIPSPSTGSSQTFSVDGGDAGTQWSAVGTIGFSGVTTLDTASAGSYTHALFAQPGSATGKVFITTISTDITAGTWTIDSGFTIIAQGYTSGGFGFAIAYKIESGEVSENPKWSVSGPSGTPSIGCTMTGFK